MFQFLTLGHCASLPGVQGKKKREDNMVQSWGYRMNHRPDSLIRVLNPQRSDTRPVLSREEHIPTGGAVLLNRSPRRIPKTTSETNPVVQSLLPHAIHFKDKWLGSLLSTRTTVDKYPLRSCVSVISFPPERRLNNCAESALINGYGGKRMCFCSHSAIMS